MQILAGIQLFNVCETRRDIKKLMFFMNPVQAKTLHFNFYIYILYCQSNIPHDLALKYSCYPYQIFQCNQGI